MKNLKIFGITALMTLALSGCQNTSDREAALEDQVAQLEQQVTSLEKENDKLSETAEESKDAVDTAETTDTKDTIDDLTSAVNDIVKKVNNTSADSSKEDNQETFFKLIGELQEVENRLERYEDNIESDFHQGNLSYENAREEELKIEQLEDLLDDAEDKLANKFGYDD